jgi:hypothetical protein
LPPSAIHAADDLDQFMHLAACTGVLPERVLDHNAASRRFTVNDLILHPVLDGVGF